MKHSMTLTIILGFILGLVPISSNDLHASDRETKRVFREVMTELQSKTEVCDFDWHKYQSNALWGAGLGLDDPEGYFVDHLGEVLDSDIEKRFLDQNIRLEWTLSSELEERGCDLSSDAKKFNLGAVSTQRIILRLLDLVEGHGRQQSRFSFKIDVIRIIATNLRSFDLYSTNRYERNPSPRPEVDMQTGNISLVDESGAPWPIVEETILVPDENGTGTEVQQTVATIRVNPSDYEVGLILSPLMNEVLHYAE